jgi:hypothetical protein
MMRSRSSLFFWWRGFDAGLARLHDSSSSTRPFFSISYLFDVERRAKPFFFYSFYAKRKEKMCVCGCKKLFSRERIRRRRE